MNLLFDFTVNKDTKTISVTRQFAAGLDTVWDAFTKAEILDLWSAPKPWKLRTKEMDFREGGRWLYAMVSPENAMNWSLVEFINIQPKSSFTARNSFCDENGNSINNVSSITTNSFRESEGITTVYIEKKFDDLAVIEMMVSRGFKEGTTMAMANLDEYLLSITNSNK